MARGEWVKRQKAAKDKIKEAIAAHRGKMKEVRAAEKADKERYMRGE
ncbi:MAG: hypothetical protein Q7J55_04190 [bacterium]|nr:hypothetical protein [bacterium]